MRMLALTPRVTENPTELVDVLAPTCDLSTPQGHSRTPSPTIAHHPDMKAGSLILSFDHSSPIYPPTHLPIHQSTHSPTHQFIYPHVCLPIHLPTNPFIGPSMHPSSDPFTHPSPSCSLSHLSSVYLGILTPTHPSIHSSPFLSAGSSVLGWVPTVGKAASKTVCPGRGCCAVISMH